MASPHVNLELDVQLNAVIVVTSERICVRLRIRAPYTTVLCSIQGIDRVSVPPTLLVAQKTVHSYTVTHSVLASKTAPMLTVPIAITRWCANSESSAAMRSVGFEHPPGRAAAAQPASPVTVAAFREAVSSPPSPSPAPVPPVVMCKCRNYDCDKKIHRIPRCVDGQQCKDPLCMLVHPFEQLTKFSYSNRLDLLRKFGKKCKYDEVYKVLSNALKKHLFDMTQTRKDAVSAMNQFAKQLVARTDLAADGKSPVDEVGQAITKQVEMMEQSDSFQTVCIDLLKRRLADKLSEDECIAALKREVYRLGARLPALARRTQMEDALRQGRFVVVKGHTGSGKSTQLPQYIADMAENAGKYVICTQPRKIAAISLAERVAMEYAAGNKAAKAGWQVGYRVGGKRCEGRHSRIIYMTEGTLLDMIVSNKGDFKNCAAIVLDEAHERTLDLDVLLGLLKRDDPRWSHIKVAVTSATIDTTSFANFLSKAPVVEIAGRLFPIEIVYAPEETQLEGEQLVMAVVRQAIAIHSETAATDGDILCFLTGQDDVERAKALFDAKLGKAGGFASFSLFGKQQPEQQQEIFKKLPSGTRKVVFATDIAETSITIDGVRFVVDCGNCKGIVYDSKRNISSLRQFSISRSSAVQRAGRSGRTAPGTCYRLYSKDQFQLMDENDQPEIFRRPLALAVVSLAVMKIRASSFDWISAPTLEAIQAAESELKFLGAIRSTTGQDVMVTELGLMASKLQLDPAMARIIQRGLTDGCGETALAVVALLGVASNLFWRGNTDKEQKEAAEARKRFSHEAGDVSTIFKVFVQWCEAGRQMASDVRSPPRGGTAAAAATATAAAAADTDDEGERVDQESLRALDETSAVTVIRQRNVEKDQEDADDEENQAEEPSDAESMAGDLMDDAASVASEDSDISDVPVATVLPWSARLDTRKCVKWSMQNYVNNKALGMALATIGELRHALRSAQLWQGEQTRQLADEQVVRLAFAGLFLNTAALVSSTSYNAVMSNTIGIVPSSSALSLLTQRPQWICFQSILRTRAALLIGATAVQEDWFAKESQEFWAVFQERRSKMRTDAVTLSGLHQFALRAIIGRGRRDIDQLEEKLQCSLEPDFERGVLTAWCTPAHSKTVLAALESSKAKAIEAAANEFLEEPVTSSLRAVYGIGGEVTDLLFNDELITIVLRNLPPDLTSDEVAAQLARYGTVRAVELTGATRTSSQAKVTFYDKTAAITAKAALNNELWPKSAHLVDVHSGGHSHLAVSHGVTASLTVSWALSPSTGNASILMPTAVSCNAVFDQRAYLFPGMQVFIAGIRPGGKPPKVPLKPEQLAVMPPLEAISGRLDERLIQTVDSARAAKFQFRLVLKNVPAHMDEFDLNRIVMVWRPISVRVTRTPPVQKVTETGLAKFIQDLLPLIPMSELSTTTCTSFLREKDLRAGFIVQYANTEQTVRAAALVKQSDIARRVEHGQPMRVEPRFVCFTTLHEALAKRLTKELDTLKQLASQRQVTMTRLEPKTASTNVGFRFTAAEPEYFNYVRQYIDNLTSAHVFNHPQKDALFSLYGRKCMEQISKDASHIFWNKFDRTIHLFGTDSERQDGEQRLNDVIADVLQVKEQKWLLKLNAVEQVQKQLPALRKIPDVKLVELGRRALLVMASSDAAFAAVSAAVADKVVPTRSKPTGTEAFCECCYYTDPKPELQLKLCGHHFHHECIAPMVNSMTGTLKLPVKCPAFCGCTAMLAWADIVSISSAENLKSLKYQAMQIYARSRPAILFKCPVATCLQYCPVTQDTAYCAECVLAMCIPCSNHLGKAIEQHDGLTCEEARDSQRNDLFKVVQYVQERVLNQQCPRCHLVFADFVGCLALTCANTACNAGFCALCLEDCGSDAHSHVTKCAKRPSDMKDTYFLSRAKLDQVWTAIRKQQTIAALMKVPDRTLRRQALYRLDRDLRFVSVQILPQEIGL
eukprot:TRINITY_DN128_c0_g3_i1.p1 TRINITY_DN128_c0_g3~~TRINITY_DN128_c0_g3_i1.p1  ORF type:complete len:1956 (-),score=417.65 TRINITY_DN128_c0_g3_i1:56-5923(-)